MNDTKKPEFPDAQKNFLSRIPAPVKMIAIVIIGVMVLLVIWPKGKKAKTGKAGVEQVVKMDALETENPIDKNTFGTEATVTPNKEEALMAKSTEIGEESTRKEATDADRIQERPSIESHSRPSMEQMSGGSYTPPPPISSGITKRLDNSYQQMVSHFKGTSQMAVVAVTGEEYNKLTTGGNALASVEPQLRNISEDAEWLKNRTKVTIPAGSRIRAVTLQEVNSDHPGYFTARITGPSELSGYTLVCSSKGNTRDRIPVSIDKIVSPEGKENSSPSGEVQMNYAGLEGEIKSHYVKRLLPPIASAFVGAGAGYLYYKEVSGGNLNAEGQRINTADGVVGPAYQVGVQGVQDEITRMGGDNPNTVIVPKGTAFDILVTQALEMAL